MLSRVIAKNVGDVFFETQCTFCHRQYRSIFNHSDLIGKLPNSVK